MENLKKFLLSTMLLLVCGIAGAQKIEVSGTVTDSNGETVIGATVMEKGTANGTVPILTVILSSRPTPVPQS